MLGLVAGTCAGYLIQAGRAPTKLPPLSQPTLTQARGEAPERLSAAQDARVRTEGDLRKLLLKKPAGAKDVDWLEGEDGWMDMAAYADTFEDPDGVFDELVAAEFRRAAVTGWSVGSSYTVEIRLVQYRQEEHRSAAGAVKEEQYWLESQDTENRPIPGTGNGMVYVHDKPEAEPGYLPMYSAEAHASRGDIALQIWLYGTRPIKQKTVMDLAERQMERL